MNSKKKEHGGRLTEKEFRVMNILWAFPDGAFGQEIQDRLEEPKPDYTTTLTFLKILQEKGFVTAQKEGRCSRFKAAVSREDYTDRAMTGVKESFFGGSVSSLVSYFVKREKLSQSELDEIIDIIKAGRK